ncbi:MAG: hypothetical protein ABIO69_09360, partial [Sphingomicrobium sp.]
GWGWGYSSTATTTSSCEITRCVLTSVVEFAPLGSHANDRFGLKADISLVSVLGGKRTLGRMGILVI